MTNPIAGKIAMQAMQQPSAQALEKAVGPKGSKASFQEVMTQKQQEVEATQKTQAPIAPEKVNKSESSQRMESFVEGVLNDEKKIDRLMAKNIKGGGLEQSELLQLQGLIYGYSQKVDLASKVVDKATGGLKQIMNTQV